MKKTLFLTGLIVFLATGVWGQTIYRWTGASNAVWNNAGNWTVDSGAGTTFPGAADTAIIPNVTPNPYPGISSNITLYAVILDGGWITVASGNNTVNITNLEVTALNGIFDTGNGGPAGSGVRVTGTLTLNGTLNLPNPNANSHEMAISNLIVGSAGEKTGTPTPFTLNGATLAVSTTAVTLSGTTTGTGTANLEIDGSRTLNSGGYNFGNVTVTAGTVTLATSNLAAANLTITGDLDANGRNITTGNLTINSGGSLTHGSGAITVSGIWANADTYTAGTGTLTFNGATVTGINTFGSVTCTGAVGFGGNNSFSNLNLSANAEVTFASGSTQTITNMAAAGTPALLKGSTAVHWFLSNKPSSSGSLITIQDCEPSSPSGSLGLIRNVDAIDGSNNSRIFTGGTFEWTGTTSNRWEINTNWDVGYYPDPTDSTTEIIIPSAYTTQLTLDRNVVCGDMEIQSGATINLSTFNLTVAAVSGESTGILDNSGIIQLAGSQAISVTTYSGGYPGGTIQYQNATTLTSLPFDNIYTNLIVDGEIDISGILTVHGTATIGSDITTTGNQSYGIVTLAGAGTRVLNAGTGTISLGPITGSSPGLTITTSAAAANAVTLNGGSGIGALQINGNATFATALLSAASVNVSGTSAINANITTTGAQTYTNAVTLGAPITLNPGAATVTFLNTVNSDVTNRNLTISGNVVFGGVVGGGSRLAVLNVTGNSTINANINTTGTQTYGTNNGVNTTRLGDDVDFDSSGGALIRFNGTVAGDGTDHALKITTGDARFQQAVSGITSLEVANGTTRVVTGITTTEGQIYGGAVTLGTGNTVTSVTFASQADELIHFKGTIASNNGTGRQLIISDADVRFDGTVGVVNPISSVSVNGGGTSYINTTAITTTAITGNGQTYSGPVILGANVNFTGGANSLIQFSDTVEGDAPPPATARSLTITNANVRFDGAVGDATIPLASVTVTNPVGTSAINADITTTGNQNYVGAVTLGGATPPRVLTSTGGSITAGSAAGTQGVTIIADAGITVGSGGSLAGNVTLTNNTTGAISFNSASAGTLNLTAVNGNSTAASSTINVTHGGPLVVSGASSAAGNITLSAAGAVTVNAGISTGAAINLTSTGGAVSGTGLLTGTDLIADANSGINLSAANLISGSAVLRNTEGATQTNAITFNNDSAALNLTAINGNATAASSTINVTNTGTMTVTGASSANGTITLRASNGSVGRSAAGSLTAPALLVYARAGIVLDGTGVNVNQISGSVELYNNLITATPIAGEINFTNDSSALNLTAVNANTTAASSTINVTNTGTMTVTGASSAEGNITLDAVDGLAVNANIGTGSAAGTIITLRSGGGEVVKASAAVLTSPNLAVSAHDGINLGGTANLISTSAVLNNNFGGAPPAFIGSINFNNDSAALNLTAVNANTTAASSTIDVTNTGNLNINGTSSANGTITLNAGGNIVVGAAINGGQLLAYAGPGDTSTVSFNSAVNISGTGGTEGTDAAIYVNAGSFSATTGANAITPGSAGQLCLMINSTPAITTAGTVAENRFHIHPRNHGNLVYGNGPDPGNDNIPYGDGTNNLSNVTAGSPYNYLYINSSSASLPSEYHVDSNRNIYVIDVGAMGTNTNANARALNLIVDGATPTGWIEFRGAYASSATNALTLTPGSGGVRFADASGPTVINLSNSAFTLPAGVNLNLRGGTVATNPASITATSITLQTVTSVGSGSNHLTLASTAAGAVGDIVVTGAMGTTTNSLGNIVVTPTSTTATATFSGIINAYSYTQNAGNAIFTAVQNYSGVSSSTPANAFEFRGTVATMSSILNSSNPSGHVIFTTGSTLTLAGAVTLNTNAGGNISLRAINGTGNLTIQNSAGSIVDLNEAVNITGAFTQTGGGTVNLYGDIETTSVTNANISIGGHLVLQGTTTPRTISSTGGGSTTGTRNITFSTIAVGAINNLTVNAGTGDITFGGMVGSTTPPGVTPGTPLGNIILGDGAESGTVNINADIYAALVIFNGGVNQKATSDGVANRLGDVRINNETVLTLSGSSADSIRQRNNSTLTLMGGTPAAVLDTGNSSWRMGTGASDNFVIHTGELVMGAGSKLRTSNFTAPPITVSPSPYTITFSGPGSASIVASGNVDIGNNVTFGNGFVTAPHETNIFLLEMNGGTTRDLIVGTNVAIGSLRLTGNNTRVRITSDIEIRGDVFIEPYTTLEAGTSSTAIEIHVTGYSAGAKWYQTDYLENDMVDGLSGTFVPNRSTVQFGSPANSQYTPGAVGTPRREFKIAGKTDWYNLYCFEPNTDIFFSNYGISDLHTHTIHHEFIVEPRGQTSLSNPTGLYGTAGNYENMIKISRLTDPDPPVNSEPPLLHGGNPVNPPDKEPTDDFWYFNLASGAELFFNYVYLNYSYSQRRIPLPYGDPAQFLVIATPYYSQKTDSSGSIIGTSNLYDPRGTIDLSITEEYSFYNVNWFVANKFFYSFTEDSTGNGKIDRIRAQAAFELMDGGDLTPEEYAKAANVHAFDLFDVKLDGGYEVDEKRGYRGYDRVPNATDCIYIYIKEKPYLDGDARPTWWIDQNRSLMDRTTRTVFIGERGHDPLKAYDTVPPRINYTFALPGHTELFLQLSEPVNIEDINLPTGIQSTIGDLTPLLRNGEFLGEFLIDVSPPGYSLSDLAQTPTPTFDLVRVRDMAGFVEDERSREGIEYPYQFPSPKYPEDWNYSSYVEVRGWYTDPAGYKKEFTTVSSSPPSPAPPLPPIREWYTSTNTSPILGNLMFGQINGLSDAEADYGKGKHRVTDLLISIPPENLSEALQHNYFFVWPLWAKYAPEYDDTLDDPLMLGNLLHPGYGYMGSDGSNLVETSVIWDFTGKRFLERDNIVMQSRQSNTFSAGAWNVYSVTGRLDDYKATTVHGSVGLWHPYQYDPPPFITMPSAPSSPPPLPTLGSNEFLNMVPRSVPVSVYKPPSPFGTSSSPLYNHFFDISDFPGNTTVEFFYRLTTGSGLLMGRLDLPADIPAGTTDLTLLEGKPWYRWVRPFSFGIHDITRQRGGVTILNNVINSNNRERVYVDYKPESSGRVTIQVFTLDGNLVKILKRGSEIADDKYHRVSWDGTNQGGRPVARGMYFIRVVAPGIDEIRKVMVVK